MRYRCNSVNYNTFIGLIIRLYMYKKTTWLNTQNIPGNGTVRLPQIDHDLSAFSTWP